MILRQIIKEDIPVIFEWLRDIGTMRYMLTYLPYSIGTLASPEDEDLEHDEINAYGANHIFGVGAKDSGKLIGTMGLYDIQERDGRAYTRTLLGDRSYHQGGYGIDAKMHLLKYAFDTVGLRKICANVHGTHAISYMYNNTCGFEVEAVLKEHSVVGNKLTDWLCMRITREMWEPKWREYQQNGHI